MVGRGSGPARGGWTGDSKLAAAGRIIHPAATGGLGPLMAAVAPERSWTAEALCATHDPDELFVTGAAQRQAARLCEGCPVRLECLADALDSRVEFGVWGGLTERQRRALLRKHPGIKDWRQFLERSGMRGRSAVG